MTKDELIQLVEDLLEKQVIMTVDKDRYVEVINTSTPEQAAALIHAELSSKLDETSQAILENAVEGVGQFKDQAEESGDPELIGLANQADDNLDATLKDLDTQIDSFNKDTGS